MREQIPEVVNEEFTNGFGFWLQENEKQDAAIALFIENIQNYPESANTYDSLSWAYMHADQVDLALENMEKARDLEPTAANRAAQIAWMREYLQVQAQAETIPVETLRRYVGNYREHRITLNGNDLYCERTENKRAYRLVPLSADSFVIEGDVLRRLRFIAAEEKHAHKIVVTVMEEWQEEIARNGQ
jgi:tetratricopeptide (TPR) repeat protein